MALTESSYSLGSGILLLCKDGLPVEIQATRTEAPAFEEITSGVKHLRISLTLREWEILPACSTRTWRAWVSSWWTARREP